MKLILVIVPVWLLVILTDANFVIKGNVKKRNTVIKINDNFPPPCFYNNSIFRNNGTLRRIVFASKYIFTGKISSVQRRRRDNGKPRSVIKVFIRRVLKGDIGAFSDILNFETRTKNSSSRAYVFAEGKIWQRRCAGASQGWAAIMFSADYSSPLKLLTDPVPSSLDVVRKVKAMIKGNVSTLLLQK